MKKILVIILLLGAIFAQGNVRIVGKDANGNSNFFKVQSDGSSDVNLQDQTSDPVIIKFNKVLARTTLADTCESNCTFFVLTDTTGVGASNYMIVFNPDSLRVTAFGILSVNEDTVFVDSPSDFDYPSGSFADLATTNLAVDGSTTAQTFGVRGVSPEPVGKAIDITRIIVNCQTDGAVDLSKFGDIAGGLTKGLLLRTRNGRLFNVFNVKTNGELASLAYDWTPFASTNPQQGQDGFLLRLTFAGQNKMGVAVRLNPGFDLEFIVQDDLSSIDLLEITAEGHFVED